MRSHIHIEPGEFRTMDCWASILGNCGSKQSAEHIVSKGVFAGLKTVTVEGLPFCLNGPKKIGLSSAVSNFLCDRHNSALSPTDAAATQAASIFRQIQTAIQVHEKNLRGLPVGSPRRRREIARHKRRVSQHTITDANLLERWFLKTAINVFIVSPHTVGRDPKQPETSQFVRPPEKYVRAAFGLEPFPIGWGLYQFDDSRLTMRDSFEMTGVTDNSHTSIFGAAVSFWGFRFILNFGMHLSSPYAIPNCSRAEWRIPTNLIYHKPNLEVSLDGKYPDTVHFNW